MSWTISDTERPHLTDCHTNKIVYAEKFYEVANLPQMDAVDNSGVPPDVTCDKQGSVPEGSYNVTCIATDEASNSNTCWFHVTVIGMKYRFYNIARFQLVQNAFTIIPSIGLSPTWQMMQISIWLWTGVVFIYMWVSSFTRGSGEVIENKSQQSLFLSTGGGRGGCGGRVPPPSNFQCGGRPPP